MGGSDDPGNLVWLSPTAHAIMSVLQSEHYGRPCVHPGQLKFLPRGLVERGKYWVKECARLGQRGLRKKFGSREEYCEYLSNLARKNNVEGGRNAALAIRSKFPSEEEYKEYMSELGKKGGALSDSSKGGKKGSKVLRSKFSSEEEFRAYMSELGKKSALKRRSSLK